MSGVTWSQVSAALSSCPNASVVPLVADDVGEATRKALGVDADATLGVVIARTAGVLIDDGWVRLHGAGSAAIPSVDEWGRAEPAIDDALVVAHDVLGGFFAVDLGAFANDDGTVWYLGPDTLEWETLAFGYASLFHMLLDLDALEQFYEGLRWDGWREDVRALDGRTVFDLEPPPWAESFEDPNAATRTTVPVTQLWSDHTEGAED